MLEGRLDTDDDPTLALTVRVPWLTDERTGRIVRAMSVSLGTSVLSLSVLALLVHLSSLSPAEANVIASIAGIGPSFALNRRLAWRCTGRGHVRRELLPFWGYALCSLAVSTAAVDLAGRWAEAAAVAPATRTVVVLLANIGSSMVLWVGQFVLLERTLLPRPAEA